MSNENHKSVAELLADHALIEAAITRAVREAVLAHARAGRPVAAWENGKAVWVSPDEVLARLAKEGANGTAPAKEDTPAPQGPAVPS